MTRLREEPRCDKVLILKGKIKTRHEDKIIQGCANELIFIARFNHMIVFISVSLRLYVCLYVCL